VRAARVILVVGAALLLARAVLAGHLGLFSDEAYYWMCSRRLDLAFADEPVLVALLVRGGTALAGDTTFGVRLLFLGCSALLPAVVWALARPLVSREQALLAAALTLALPVVAATGTLATPDAPLLVLSAATLAAFERATRTGARRWWVATGVAAGLGFCTHLRFSLVVFAALLFLLLTRAGRRHWRTAGPWLAAGLALLGLLPLLVFNVREDFATFVYHLHDRHQVGRGPIAWPRHLVEQALATSPLLYVALLASAVAAVRRARAGDERAGLLACFALVPLGVYFLASPLSDISHNYWHWPQIGYLPLLVLLPGQLTAWRDRGRLLRGAAVLAPALGLGVLAFGQLDLATGFVGWVPRHPFAGWSAMADAVRAELRPTRVVVADTYIAGAELSFELGGAAEIYVLDHPVNHKHGRALQYRLWGLDEPALASRAGQEVLLVLDEDTTRRSDRTAWDAHVRALFSGLDGLHALEADGRSFELGPATLAAAPTAGS
jgi:4-amino-4-deoxy-L-arabinose transferase-like glycosyltransferase